MSKKQTRLLSGVLAALWMLTIFFLSHRPRLGGFGLLDLIPFGDKLVHAVAFGILALLIYGSSRRLLLSLVLTSLYGLSDEIHQSFVAGRTADLFDWLSDTVGAALALGAWAFYRQKKT